MTLKTRADGDGAGPTYKKKLFRFEEGSPHEWLRTLDDLEELWTQNSVLAGADRLATVRTLLRGDSLSQFESEITDLLANRNFAFVTPAVVEAGLKAVSKAVFPHRALETQKLWMRRGMKKPKHMATRQLAAAIAKINSYLPRFPGATDDDKFSATEIVELIEWSLPAPWRTKFDLDGYVPTLHSKAKLVEACEAIERNEPDEKSGGKGGSNTKKNKNDKKSVGKGSGGGSGAAGNKKFYCAKHGWNASHGTDKCFVIKKEQEAGNNPSASSTGSRSNPTKQFSRKNFRKEVNLMASAKGSSKRQVLDLYASAVKAEQKKLSAKQASKPAKKAKKSPEPSDSSDSSDSEMSVQVLEPTPVIKRAAMRASLKKSISRANARSAGAVRRLQRYSRAPAPRRDPVNWATVLSSPERSDTSASDTGNGSGTEDNGTTGEVPEPSEELLQIIREEWRDHEARYEEAKADEEEAAFQTRIRGVPQEPTDEDKNPEKNPDSALPGTDPAGV